MKRAFLFDFLGRDLRRARPHDEAEESFLGVIASLTALMAGLASLALMQPCSSAHNHTQCKHAHAHISSTSVPSIAWAVRQPTKSRPSTTNHIGSQSC